MKALVWEAPRVMSIRDQAEPALAPGEVLLKVVYAGICGSELSGYLGHNALRVPPLVMGHEFAGTIAAMADDVSGLSEGQLATANPMWFCGECRFCARGQTHLCPKRRLIGAHRPGAYAEYVAVPAKLVAPLPAGMPARIGALAEPVAVALHIAELAGPAAPDSALILGAGPIGLLALQALRGRGTAQVFVADLDPERLAMAAALGAVALDPRDADVAQAVRAATGGEGAPVTIDAVGAAITRATCVSATCSGGLLILSGLHEETSAFPAAEVIRREITVQGGFCYTQANVADAIDQLSRGAIRLDPWIVEAPLEEGGAWFERLIGAPGNVAKVLLIP